MGELQSDFCENLTEFYPISLKDLPYLTDFSPQLMACMPPGVGPQLMACMPPGVVLQEELESMQKRAARFVTGNYSYEIGSVTGILGQLKWESLKKRRKDNKPILLYKGLKGKASVSTDDLIPKTRRCRNQHSMAFQTPIANTDVYKSSFFPKTIRDWNALPDSLISSAEDPEDCVS